MLHQNSMIRAIKFSTKQQGNSSMIGPLTGEGGAVVVKKILNVRQKLRTRNTLSLSGEYPPPRPA